MQGLFITGTDTGVGKTYVTAALAREFRRQGVNAGVYKPAATGSIVDTAGQPHWPDVEALSRALDGRFPDDRICPQRFHAPLAPPVAARGEGTRVDPQRLRAGADWWRGQVDVLLVEGVGGLLCPLTECETVADLAADLRFPLVIVARQALGTINHTFLTIEAARARGLQMTGIILNEVEPRPNDPSVESNADEIEARGCVPVLTIVAHGQVDGLLLDRRGRTMDWRELCGAAERD